MANGSGADIVAYIDCGRDEAVLRPMAEHMLTETREAFAYAYRVFSGGLPKETALTAEVECGARPGITLVYDMAANPRVAAELAASPVGGGSDITDSIRDYNLRVDSKLLRAAMGQIELDARQRLPWAEIFVIEQHDHPRHTEWRLKHEGGQRPKRP